MSSLLLVLVIIGVPTIMAIILRVSAVYFYLAIAAGGLLVNFLADDASLALSVVFDHANTNLIAGLALLLLPIMLTVLFLKKTTPKRKAFLNVIPLIACGFMFGVLVLPLLDSNTQALIFDNHYGNIFKSFQDIIVGITTMLVLLLAWTSGRIKGSKHSKHKF